MKMVNLKVFRWGMSRVVGTNKVLWQKQACTIRTANMSRVIESRS